MTKVHNETKTHKRTNRKAYLPLHPCQLAGFLQLGLIAWDSTLLGKLGVSSQAFIMQSLLTVQVGATLAEPASPGRNYCQFVLGHFV